ncbi:MAG: CoA ester lyase [Longimicrobiales bacterium]|nr:CoA ester lyase [Longimicrobiales bacterium]
MIHERCLLFFPGTRPELMPKAAATDADRICIDLEDSVPPRGKAQARTAVHRALESSPGEAARLAVRINHPSSPWGADDLAALDGWAAEGLTRVMLPKTASPDDVSTVLAACGGHRSLSVIVVIETLRGVKRVEAIAASEGVAGLLFGALDLSVELGCALEWEPLLHARSTCVLAARLTGIAVVDTPFFDVRDEEGLRRESVRARSLGFTGKAAIHPHQVGVIRPVFAPSAQEIRRARRVVEVAGQEGDGAFLLDGVMVDAPVVEAARRLLERAGADEEIRPSSSEGR